MIDTDENKLCWHCLKELKSKSGKTRHIDSIIFCTVCWPVVSCSSPTTTRMTPRSGPRPSLTWAMLLRPVSRSFACFRTAKRRCDEAACRRRTAATANNAPKTAGSTILHQPQQPIQQGQAEHICLIKPRRLLDIYILCGNFIHNNRKSHS